MAYEDEDFEDPDENEDKWEDLYEDEDFEELGA
jgi:hypothetical protein